MNLVFQSCAIPEVENDNRISKVQVGNIKHHDYASII